MVIYFIFTCGLCFYYLIFYNKNNFQKVLKYENQLSQELVAINRIYKANLPIINSRNFTSSTKYNILKMKKKKNLSNTIFINFCKRKNKILIAIHSHVILFYERYVFRKIYKRYTNITILFFMGIDYNNTINNLVFKEMKEYRDIILFDIYCDYSDLHLQTYKFLYWIKKYKYLYDVIIKQDTDTFININILKLILQDLLYKNITFVMGRIWYYNDNTRKYPSGMAYIFLSKSIDLLMINIDRVFCTLRKGYPEDIFFGILARKANFSFIDSYKTYNYTTYLFIPNYIFDANTIFMIHWLRISEIAFLHFNLSKYRKERKQLQNSLKHIFLRLENKTAGYYIIVKVIPNCMTAG